MRAPVKPLGVGALIWGLAAIVVLVVALNTLCLRASLPQPAGLAFVLLNYWYARWISHLGSRVWSAERQRRSVWSGWELLWPFQKQRLLRAAERSAGDWSADHLLSLCVVPISVASIILFLGSCADAMETLLPSEPPAASNALVLSRIGCTLVICNAALLVGEGLLQWRSLRRRGCSTF